MFYHLFCPLLSKLSQFHQILRLTISLKSEREARPSLSWSIFFIVISTRSLAKSDFTLILNYQPFNFGPHHLFIVLKYIFYLTPSSCSSVPTPSIWMKRLFFIRLNISSLFDNIFVILIFLGTNNWSTWTRWMEECSGTRNVSKVVKPCDETISIQIIDMKAKLQQFSRGPWKYDYSLSATCMLDCWWYMLWIRGSYNWCKPFLWAKWSYDNTREK